MSEHLRADYIWPKILQGEMLRLASLRRDWVGLEPKNGDGKEPYLIRTNVDTNLPRPLFNSSDLLGLWAGSIYLHDGPKIFRPTEQQCEAMANVSVNLNVSEYEQPYDAILVDVKPHKSTAPFESVIVAKLGPLLVCVMFSEEHANDVTTTAFGDRAFIEDSLAKSDPSLMTEDMLGHKAHIVARIAVNCCLALTQYGTHSSYLFPSEVARDKHFAREKSERGEKATHRLKFQPVVLSFAQDVKLHREERRTREPGEATGREMPCHWRRGHWHRVAHGVGRAERKLVFYKPVLVRSDLFGGPSASTSTTYRG